MKMSVTEAQRLLLGILASVESGVTEPKEAVTELADIKRSAGPNFKADYTVEDFKNIRAAYITDPDDSVEFEQSESY